MGWRPACRFQIVCARPVGLVFMFCSFSKAPSSFTSLIRLLLRESNAHKTSDLPFQITLLFFLSHLVISVISTNFKKSQHTKWKVTYSLPTPFPQVNLMCKFSLLKTSNFILQRKFSGWGLNTILNHIKKLTAQKTQTKIEKNDKFYFIKMKTYALWKTLLRKWDDKPQSGRKYLWWKQSN